MVKKYYAVKKGRHPGIYKTWAECQKEVNGYPNAKFKSFLTLEGANEWLQATGNTVTSTKAVAYSNNILVYTDGGSRNHGNKLGQHVKADDKAAWAYFIQTKDRAYTGTAGEFGATNNKMEITALIQALTKLLELGFQDQPVTAILDSHYVLDPIMKGWLTNWQRRGWLTAGGKPVANQKLWEEIVSLLPQFPNLHFDWTKGHATNAGNNKVDELLNKTMDQL
ncbi:ribonuclease H family protein [Limosilactobacillus reuteri]|uniref:ribonuclease H family protein n=1 Tax=Limosilactobacillus reuteri TaxID=1598 RepID=UPI001E40ECDE|nr:ribonuclease H family protein [Limosilactobacillus reuteri]MCC4325775.1 ribonuclease H family protein [Limosilactobacillus reuteri]MCC4329748.1 ribonuclease H family protein [Limosilactobacillus reuteri]MCC4352460.1 ribonuclease H family protein [Limosilactobacillus reuteri]MCC4377267.1 ribonuclease H family protein [Limosilactobacillus reuteri]